MISMIWHSYLSPSGRTGGCSMLCYFLRETGIAEFGKTERLFRFRGMPDILISFSFWQRTAIVSAGFVFAVVIICSSPFRVYFHASATGHQNHYRCGLTFH